MKTKQNRLENYLFDYIIQVWNPYEQKLMFTCDTEKRAANALGVEYRVVERSYSKKDRFYSPSLKMEVTCRAKEKKEDMKFNKQGILIV